MDTFIAPDRISCQRYPLAAEKLRMTVATLTQNFSIRMHFICTVMSLLLSSCGGNGGSAAAPVAASTSPISLPTGNNVATVVVDSGPSGATSILNVPYVSITVC